MVVEVERMLGCRETEQKRDETLKKRMGKN